MGKIGLLPLGKIEFNLSSKSNCDNNKLISSEKYLYKDEEISYYKTELKNYNENEQLTDHKIINIIKREDFPDTTFTLYSEQNFYSNTNL